MRRIPPGAILLAMTTRIANKLTPRSVLIDAVMDRYVDWREESAAVRCAYGLWSNAVSADRFLTHAAYEAALDREERAADLYSAAIDAYRGVAR